MGRMIRLESGKWYAEFGLDANREDYLRLSCPGAPANSMRVPLPFSWRGLDDNALRELARRPEVRLWLDEFDIHWRVAAVGPGTRYPFPLPGRYLVFDSEEAWSGIVRFEPPAELGDLTDVELRELRQRVSDFGGSREGFRPPVQTME